MVHLSVSQAADRLGVNVQRVHQRIADGSLPAARVGRQWVIAEADLARLDRHPAGRPLSPRSAWEVALVASVVDARAYPSGDPRLGLLRERAASIPASNRSRARSRLKDLLMRSLEAHLQPDAEVAALDVAAKVRSLLRGRADRRTYRLSPRDLEDLRADERIRPSGVSLPEAGIAAGDLVEGYVADSDIGELVAEFLLAEARDADANVVLHVVSPAASDPPWAPVDSWIILAADLAEHHRPREVARAAQIVRAAAERLQPVSA